MQSTDFRALGRLGQPIGTVRRDNRRRRAVRKGSRRVAPVVGTGMITRRPRVPRPVTAVLVLLGLSILWLGVAAGSETPDPGTVPAGEAMELDPAVADLAAGEAATEDGTRMLVPGGGPATAVPVLQAPALAAIGDLLLLAPSAESTHAAFHEATVSDALALTPVGRMVANANPEGFVPPAEVEGLPYEVLAPTEGIRPPTSAVAVLVPDGATLLAPVSGQVVAVEEFATADRARDWRVVLLPAGRTDVHVVVRHLLSPLVAVGDEVTAGATEVGVARPPGTAGAPGGMVTGGLPWTEVYARPATAERPLDPNRPALAPEA